MASLSADINAVEMLPEKTEATELKLVLKTALGGYTKESVKHYLTMLRERQQEAEETFNQSLQAMLGEKESLKAENEALKQQLTKKEIEYASITEALLPNNLDGETDINSLKGCVAALENELARANEQKAGSEKTNSELKSAIKALENRLEQSAAETQVQAELLAQEKNKSTQQRAKMLELISIADALRDEIKYFKGIICEDKLDKLTAEVNELMTRVNTQTAIIASYKSNVAAKDLAIDTMTGEIEGLRINNSLLSSALENTGKRNEKLDHTNRVLSNKLKEEYSRTLELIGEKTDIEVERLIAVKKLNETNSKISTLELGNVATNEADVKKRLFDEFGFIIEKE